MGMREGSRLNWRLCHAQLEAERKESQKRETRAWSRKTGTSSEKGRKEKIMRDTPHVHARRKERTSKKKVTDVFVFIFRLNRSGHPHPEVHGELPADCYSYSIG